ncbi:hypothetical protein JYU34_009402 [Plutella xylostella]|uniref:RNA-directed DNA polymerase n=1 Tax=Plutella xylostella TaxID=51655 RepID=A0ABQ7QJD1_PLUXY|nr:hypothetical protein JYU34_009402 [Plutella xylostella]
MRFVSIIFMKLIAENKVVIFIDDLLIPAADEKEGIERLKEVLAVAEEYGLQINWKKAKLLCREVEYLGHVIGNGEVRPSPDKTDAVMKYPEPRTVKQLHSFVGLTSYFRKYIENYAQIAMQLTELLKKDKEFEFGEEQRVAFNVLKGKLSSQPVLKIFNPTLPIELHTDASCIAYSAILLQRYDDRLHPVHYMSKKTNDAEKKYSSYELEALAIVEGVKKFRHYLYGSHFKIVTDCQAFKLTLKKKDLTTRVARWVLLLDEYDYEIEHRPGSKMRHTDALSRIACVTNVSEQIRQAQQQDDGLNAIMNILKEKPYEDYMLDNGMLYKGEDKCLVIPRSMEHDIIKKIHERGHFGKRKMLELLNKDYYMKNVNKKIEDFIVGCIPCLLATKKEGKQEGFLNSIEKGGLPLDTLHCDHIGPFLETKKKYNYILTVIDGFTKFVWLFPTKGTTSAETIDKLLILQQTFGNPRRYITDRGSCFTSHDFKEYCEREEIQHVLITTGVPRANGQVERVHRTLIAVLTKMSIAEPGLWYKHVSRVQMALNSTFQRSINTSPFELLVGTKMTCKEDIEIYDLILQEERENFNQEREDLRQQAKQQILKVQQENQQQYNKKRKESNKYKEGDIVAIKRTQFGTSMKLKPKYLGPYRVTKVKRNDRYNVEKIDLSKEGPINTSSSSDYMKPWPTNDSEEGLGE